MKSKLNSLLTRWPSSLAFTSGCANHPFGHRPGGWAIPPLLAGQPDGLRFANDDHPCQAQLGDGEQCRYRQRHARDKLGAVRLFPVIDADEPDGGHGAGTGGGTLSGSEPEALFSGRCRLCRREAL